MTSAIVKPRDLIYITVIAIAVFVAATLLSNYFLKSGPEIIRLGYPFCFYYEYGGYMAQQHGSSMKYFFVDVLFAWGLAFVLYYFIKFGWRLIAKTVK